MCLTTEIPLNVKPRSVQILIKYSIVKMFVLLPNKSGSATTRSGHSKMSRFSKEKGKRV